MSELIENDTIFNSTLKKFFLTDINCIMYSAELKNDHISRESECTRKP